MAIDVQFSPGALCPRYSSDRVWGLGQPVAQKGQGMGRAKVGSKALRKPRISVASLLFPCLSVLPSSAPHSNKWLSQGVCGSRCEWGSGGQVWLGAGVRSQGGRGRELELAVTPSEVWSRKVAG